MASTVGIARRALQPPHCGDAAASFPLGGATLLCLVDGLGHGQAAEQAALAAIREVELVKAEPLDAIIVRCDLALRATRGAVMGLARVSPERLLYAGVGDTQILVAGERSRRLPSTPGVLGAGHGKVIVEETALKERELIVMTSDGLKSGIDLDAYGPSLRAEPRALAERILEDYARGTDDAVVLVMKAP